MEGKTHYERIVCGTQAEKDVASQELQSVFDERSYELLDKLVEGSGGKFKNRDEVFDEFAKANFSGNYLPLARMVEGIFGKGSFRRLAEEFSEKPKKDEHETSEEINS